MEILDTYFQEYDTELRKQLEDSGIMGTEQEEFLWDFYYKMLLKLIKEFKERVKVTTLEKTQERNATAGRKMSSKLFSSVTPLNLEEIVCFHPKPI